MPLRINGEEPAPQENGLPHSEAAAPSPGGE
jgi:hypothetical protein